jgi:hypothetical protein
MKHLWLVVAFLGSITFSQWVRAFISPHVELTPGLLCTPQDPNFSHLDYPERIARCARNVGLDEKLQIAEAYGHIPQSQWPNYEFDHLIPLCAGGSDDIKNLWPQPIAEAHKKDILENDVCLAMKTGIMTQVQAIEKLHSWFNSLALEQGATPSYLTEISCKSQDLLMGLKFSIVGNKQISNTVLTLNDKLGSHEAIKAQKVLTGTDVLKIKSPLLRGLVRYKLGERHEDTFELFLPAKFLDEQPKFNVYLKIAFEGNYPNLTKLECE